MAHRPSTGEATGAVGTVAVTAATAWRPRQQVQTPETPHRFPLPEPVTRPLPDVDPEQWPREEPDTPLAPSDVVEPAVFPRPEPDTITQPVREPGRRQGQDQGRSSDAGEEQAADAGRRPTARTEPGTATDLGDATGYAADTQPGHAVFSLMRVGDRAFARLTVRTHWFGPGEDLVAALRQYLGPHLRPGDHAIISETAVIAARGRMIPADQIRPGPMATLLARYVRPIGWGLGLSVPHKMQVAIQETGRLRVLAAAAAAAVTRPLGIRGVFYRIAGHGARSLDGMRPGSRYEHVVMPPLRPAEALAIARELAAGLGAPVHIVDINDHGGSIRASSHPFPHRLLLAILRDNPLGQGDRCRPVGLIRLWSGPFGFLGDE